MINRTDPAGLHCSTSPTSYRCATEHYQLLKMYTYVAAMSAKDSRIGRAVQIWRKSPALTVEQVMHNSGDAP